MSFTLGCNKLDSSPTDYELAAQSKDIDEYRWTFHKILVIEVNNGKVSYNGQMVKR